MKRSDAETIIVNVLNANSEDSPEELATIIIGELLGAGMLPPRRYIDTPETLNGVFIPQSFRPSQTVVNEWGPENETK